MRFVRLLEQLPYPTTIVPEFHLFGIGHIFTPGFFFSPLSFFFASSSQNFKKRKKKKAFGLLWKGFLCCCCLVDTVPFGVSAVEAEEHNTTQHETPLGANPWLVCLTAQQLKRDLLVNFLDNGITAR